MSEKRKHLVTSKGNVSKRGIDSEVKPSHYVKPLTPKITKTPEKITPTNDLSLDALPSNVDIKHETRQDARVISEALVHSAGNYISSKDRRVKKLGLPKAQFIQNKLIEYYGLENAGEHEQDDYIRMYGQGSGVYLRSARADDNAEIIRLLNHEVASGNIKSVTIDIRGSSDEVNEYISEYSFPLTKDEYGTWRYEAEDYHDGILPHEEYKETPFGKLSG